MSYFSFLLLIIVAISIAAYVFIKYNLVSSRITVSICLIIVFIVLNPIILDFPMFLKGGIELSDNFSYVYNNSRHSSYTLADSKNQEFNIPASINAIMFFSLDKQGKQNLMIRYLPNSHHILTIMQKEEYIKNRYFMGTSEMKNGEVYYIIYTDTDNLLLELLFGSIILTFLFFINKYQGLLPFPAYVPRFYGRY